MLSSLRITIPSGAKTLVSRGDKVHLGSVLAEQKDARQMEPVSMSTLLGVPKKKITSYLTKSIGVQVRQGEIIGKRRKLFTEMIVRSPVDAVISSIDLTTGMLNLVALANPITLKSPVDGRIKKVSEDAIEIDFSGKVISGIKGYGWASGSLVFFDKTKHEVLGYLSSGSVDVNKKIIVVPYLSDILVSKLRAMGAVGLIAVDYEESKVMPYIIIEKGEFKTLSDCVDRHAILDGMQSNLIIAD